MNFQSLVPFIIPLIVGGVLVRRFVLFRQAKANIPEILEKGGVIIDVRSRSEFAAASNKRSMNIPLDELAESIGRFSMEQPIVVCCASGARSRVALSQFKQKGFKDVVNAGPWKNTLM